MRITIMTALVVLLLAVPSQGQFRDQGLGMGAGFGGMIGQTDLRDNVVNYSTRAYVRYGFFNTLAGEIGVGLGRISGESYKTLLAPIDFRLVFSPFDLGRWNVYAYAGAGALYYKYEIDPDHQSGYKKSVITDVRPLGLGVQYLLVDNFALEASGGYNPSFSKKLNDVTLKDNADAYWSFLLGFSVVGEGGSADPDHDGLTNDEEKQLGTEKRKADTDGDGLSDGEEVRAFKTDPLKMDSDGDGLSDSEEVNVTHTDPNKADTDGDGLSDKDEIGRYKTDPLKADSDGDGLPDGAEVQQYKTDPLKSDSDGDGLSDGDEINKYKTDPLKADTDGGTVDDGTEIYRGTNPTDSTDDIPKPQIKVDIGQAIVLEGIVFATGKADIAPESEESLMKAYNTLNQNPEIVVEIRGYTDNKGSKSLNKKLSLARAEAVKSWLVSKGIAAERITAKGFGADSPVAPNDTDENRQKNRRIEFFRIK